MFNYCNDQFKDNLFDHVYQISLFGATHNFFTISSSFFGAGNFEFIQFMSVNCDISSPLYLGIH